jgi:cytochrome c oxidase subunit 1
VSEAGAAAALPERPERAGAPTLADDTVALEPFDRRAARKLTLAYVLTATAILAVSGMLGVLLRDSQANLGRLNDNAWYAVMTAHGLGAFLGWAGFAVMGFGFWVLAAHGFPVRGFGKAMAWVSYWTMVVGVLGIVVATLALSFGASWVFLYPLPFSSAGQWSGPTAGVFLASVLLAGVSVITWCAAILHTVLGAALHAVSHNLVNRYGVAIGLGYLFPRRFATNPRSVPYPVIPLAVIGLDMIIATLPLAVLLVAMLVEVANPSFHIDVLGAKNILWFFGHPVVYLLLFPAAAVYYHLVPKYAGRPLVAGNVIAVAWAIAVVANVSVWAHHIYVDYPTGLQEGVNTAMQPITFALTIPSALSLYSLGFTIYRSRFHWNAASTALVLGLVSWLLAGLSGVVNATIAFDVVVHNTLWIVGHFHHMALYNIGFLVFAATYHYLPELTGNRLYSETMAKVHVWVTFVAGMGFVTTWLVEGLEGAPRRFSVLPSKWDAYQTASIPFVFAIALVQLLYFVNVVQTVRGKAGSLSEPARAVPRRERRRRLSLAGAEAAYILVSVALMFAAGAAGYAIGHAQRGGGGGATAPTTAPATGTTGEQGGALARGKQVFESAGCGSCHTLAAADASGQVGPNLDQTKPTRALVVNRVTNGFGAMPPFKDQLSQQQIQDVAAFVSQSAGAGG